MPWGLGQKSPVKTRLIFSINNRWGGQEKTKKRGEKAETWHHKGVLIESQIIIMVKSITP